MARFLQILLSSVIALAGFSHSAAADIAERSSLGLEGCAIMNIAISEDGLTSFAACEGPRGLYYSRDMGSTWVFAEGGAYTSGAVVGLAAVGTNVYAEPVSGGLYKAALPATATEAWTPAWSKVGDSSNNQYVHRAGKFLFLSNGGNKVKVFDTASDSFIEQTSALSDGANISKVSVQDNLLYALAEVVVSGGDRQKTYYKASFDTSSGLIGSFSEIPSSISGYPSDKTPWSLAVAPNGYLYLAFAGSGSSASLVYVSKDQGASLEATSLQMTFNSSCFNSANFIIGTFLSRDSGASWQNIGDAQVSENGRMEDLACAINSANPEQAFLGSNRGLLKTSNLISASAAPSFQESYVGLAGVLVKATSQASGSKDRVVLGTSSGVAFTDNFTSAAPTWQFPICPGGDCVGGERVVIDPNNDNNIYYASGNIRKGVIDSSSGTAVITWSDFASYPEQDMSTSVARMYSFLPGKLVIGRYKQEGAQGGGLYFVDTATAVFTEVEDVDVKGKPIAAFCALDSTTFFGAVGAFADYPETSSRYIIKSTDGGVNWDKISDATLSPTIFVKDMAYDSASDTLYVATSQNPAPVGGSAEAGTVYVLSKAKAGGGTWKKSGEFKDSEGNELSLASFTAIAVDPNTSNVYAATDKYIFVSADAGATWSILFEGLNDELTYSLFFDTGASASSKDAKTFSATRLGLTQAAATGIYAFENAALPSCVMSVSKVCKKSAARGTRCNFDVAASNLLTKTVYAGKKIRLQQNTKNKTKGWKNEGKQAKTNSRGKASFKIKVSKTLYYRAVMQSPACTSNVKQVKVRKR